MSKTPEEMAEEFADDWHKDCDYPHEILRHTKRATANVFLVGYKAAQEQYREAVEVLDKHKAAAEKAVTNIKNASDWVTIEKAKANENT
jgi:hypothetical protein